MLWSLINRGTESDRKTDEKTDCGNLKMRLCQLTPARQVGYDKFIRPKAESKK